MAEASAHSLGSDDVSVSETCESFDFVSRPWADHVPVLNDEVISDNPVANPDVSYAEATRPAQPVKDVKVSVSTDNDVPDRPCTAFVNPRARLPANVFIDALNSAKVDPQSISCIQRQTNGEVVLTFRSAEHRESFLRLNTLEIQGQPFALQDIDRPLTYVQIFDAPYEMPDSAIIHRLSKYCDVLHHRRGYFKLPGFENVQDGVRHYRVRLKNPIPNFIRFGKILINVRYDQQPRTCRHCHLRGHFANSCHEIACYNCEQTGHQAATCPNAILCSICKQSDHRAKFCPFSWSRKPIPTLFDEPASQLDETEEIPPDTEETPPETEETTPENDEPCDSDHQMNDDFPTETEDTPDDDASPAQTSTDENMIQHDPETLSSIADPDEHFFSSDETTEMTETPELFSIPSTPPNTKRRPAKIQPQDIPLRKATQPTLVTGKKSISEVSEGSTGEPRAKKLNTGHSRSPKKKKNRK